MKIVIFEVEEWERKTFEALNAEHQVQFLSEPLTIKYANRIRRQVIPNFHLESTK
ncbi:MAG: hypothetical protein SAK29_00495 [Scytonema sp. PMC 1069.18]|nr:hypothetical protein [Scytonema sp. PMC 1069.18]MEC4882596.1 hypothetical protein [Scytonema sp. PMC 1070.18]